MGCNAFVLRFDAKGQVFTEMFLASPDFDTPTLRNICRDLGLPVRGSKAEIIDRISAGWDNNAVIDAILQHLITRPKTWITYKSGPVPDWPSCADPAQIVSSEGESEWYGPLRCDQDAEAVWYLKPVFVPHWEKPEGGHGIQEVCIRWLCFARIDTGGISLHWRGFTCAESAGALQRHNSQFRYWEHVPPLFEEIEEITAAQLEPVTLHELVLHTMWDQYRYDPAFEWTDRRIRAEAGGVSLSARAGAVVELGVGGIRHLASTIRRSVERELNTKYETELPAPEGFDEVILRTLIREFGALSYEFSLQTVNGQRLFRCHVYFGLKPDSQSSDAFPHLHVYVGWRNDREQLQFLKSHMGGGYVNANQPEQVPLF